MKIFKKCLIVVVSLFVILATQPTNVFADPTTHYFVELEPGDFIAKGDIIKYDETGSIEFEVFPLHSATQEGTSFEADTDYFVNNNNAYNKQLFLYQAAHVSIYLDGVKQGETYTVPSDLPFVIDKTTNTVTIGDYVNCTLTIPTEKLCYWTWKTDLITDPQPYDEGFQGVTGILNFFGSPNYNLDIECTTYAVNTQELTSLTVSGSATVEKNTTSTYYIHLIDQNGNEIKGDQGEISYVQTEDSSGTVDITGTEGTITYSDGYSFSIAPNTVGDLFYKFSKGAIKYIVSIYVEEAESDSIIENNGWPWATNFDNDNETVTLQTGLIGTYDEINYQWKTSTERDGTYVDCTDETSESFTIEDNESGTWYRCEIKYKVNSADPEFTTIYTKSVQVFDVDNEYIVSYRNNLSYYFVSNGKGAYAYNKDAGQFSVLGLWNGAWICTSFDPSWSIYMKKPGSSINATVHYDDVEGEYVFDELDPEGNILQPSNISSIYTRFSNYDNSNVIFDVKFSEECDAAVYTDVAMGSDDFFGDNADWAAVKANLNGSSLGNIQLFASPYFADASYHTCAFVFTPIIKSIHHYDNPELQNLKNVDTFTIDSYDNGDWDMNQYRNEGLSYDDDLGDLQYKESLYFLQKLIYNHNTGWWAVPAEIYDYNPFVIKNGIAEAMYNEDSILAVSWDKTKEISFMFGIGKAGEVPGVTWNDVEPGEEEEEEHNSGGSTWIEVPNTSASTR